MPVNNKKQKVFIEDSWITGDTCLFSITNIVQHTRARKIVGEMRKKFVNRLIDEGFIVTNDKENLSDDDVCLIMNDLAVCDNTLSLDIYKKAFDERIFKAAGEKLNIPKSLRMEDFFDNPFFPAVFKNEIANGGEDKFLIETNNQLELIKLFYNDFKNDSYYKETFDTSIFQQYINTPTDYKTYMRVLIGASGDVMGASLKYSKGVVLDNSTKGLFERHLCDSNSKYFLDCDGMFGYYSGGGNISFSQPRYSIEKQEILKAHGLNPQKPEVPQDVLEVARNIVKNCNKELGILCGMDFIPNLDDGKWYYLENQAFPAIDEWANKKKIKLPATGTVDSYIKYLELDLEARYEALMLYMKRKNEYSDLDTKQLSIL